ncbi:MAG: substrate-binding domain-containing protein [Spirochaetales bacterium]|nr:substrate-binding domain-containing protein [Spirochaetales bacterium]
MRNWLVWLLSLGAAVALFLVLTLFYQQSTPEGPPSLPTVPVVLKSTGQPMDFWDAVSQGMRQASREFGLPVETTGPPHERDIEQQLSIVEEVIAGQPPLIILAASDYNRLAEPVSRAVSLGIPVITLDSGVNSDEPISFVATDNVEAGRKAGAEMVRLMAEHAPGAVAIVSHIRETATAIEREAGVREALSGLDIAGTWFCDVNREKAYAITRDLLNQPEIGGIVALNEVATLGVADAVRDAAAQDRVIVVGFDNSVEELTYLEQGIIKATVVQRPFDMGYFAVKTAYEYLSGETVNARIYTGSLLVTVENMFDPGYQEILFPFNEAE